MNAPLRPASSPYARMCAARREFLAEWSEWVAQHPEAQEIGDEIRATERDMRSLVEIHR